MARIAGVNIPSHKNIGTSLTYIYGIGRNVSIKLLNDLKIDPETKVSDLSDTELNNIREVIDKLNVEGELRRKVSLDIKRLQEIGSYRGFRHRRNLPVRGQKTKNNARTKRGKKITIGSGRRKETKT